MRNFRRSAVLTVGVGNEFADDSAGSDWGASASGGLSSRNPASTLASTSGSAAPKSNEKFPNSVGSQAVASSSMLSPASPEDGGASPRWTAEGGCPHRGGACG